jgi:MoaA/NifB/PqqE/SkfB family radical SAM enzyme
MLKSICLHINDLCNLNCVHCWSNSGPEGKHELSDIDIIRFASILKPLGLQRISLSGGEPVLHSNIFEIVKNLINAQLLVILTTNGTVPKYISKLLSQLSKNQLKYLEIRVSIDGPEIICNKLRGDGVYKKAISSIRSIGNILGNVPVNAVIGLEIDKSKWIKFYEDLSIQKVNELALITLSPRGRGYNFEENENILANINEVKELSKLSPYNGKILIWDYLTVEHGYLLVEHDGRVILPGKYDDGDVVVGSIKTLTTELIRTTLQNKRKAMNYSYYDTLSCLKN